MTLRTPEASKAMEPPVDRQTWIRGPQLRKRWGSMANSTFYNRLERGLIPAPEYPFGPTTPYWRVDVIEAHEQQAQGKAVAA